MESGIVCTSEHIYRLCKRVCSVNCALTGKIGDWLGSQGSVHSGRVHGARLHTRRDLCRRRKLPRRPMVGQISFRAGIS